MNYIHQLPLWPTFVWDSDRILTTLGVVRNRQGRLMGQMESLGFSLRSEALLQTLTLDVIKSCEIEGDILDPKQVRSSIASRLGIDIGGLMATDRHVDGMVEMMLDATQNFDTPLTTKRLRDWHASLFPTGRSGMRRIVVGAWRDDRHGPMRVVSGAIGRERVHFEAPPASVLAGEIKSFLSWFNESSVDPVLKSGIAHLWFVTLHPFEDGNGRIARAIADMQLARADGNKERFYSMSVQIRNERREYYEILEQTQKNKTQNSTPSHKNGNGIDITPWLDWYLSCLGRALSTTETTLARVFAKARFWEAHATRTLNDRQRLMINKLFEQFEGKLTSSKWAKITKCSQDTAIRDIHDLVDQGILFKNVAGGRSTSYSLKISGIGGHIGGQVLQ